MARAVVSARLSLGPRTIPKAASLAPITSAADGPAGSRIASVVDPNRVSSLRTLSKTVFIDSLSFVYPWNAAD